MGITEEIICATHDRRHDLVSLLQELIRTPSVARPPHGEEKACQNVISGRLQALGLEVDAFDIVDVEGIENHPAYAPRGSRGPARDFRDRPNVVGRWAGAGRGCSLIMTGHVDTVPVVDKEQWAHGPFSGEMVDGRIYGRGAVDDKGPLAAMMVALAALKDVGYEPDGDLIFESVVDEEMGGGNGSLATLVAGYQADAVILGEATDLALVCAARGSFNCTIEIPGKVVHGGSLNEGLNPTDLGTEIHKALVLWGKARTLSPDVPEWLAGPGDQGRVVVSAFNAGHTTGPLVYPSLCTLAAYVPLLPGESRRGVLRELEALAEERALRLGWPESHRPQIKSEGRQLDPTTLEFLDHPIHAAVMQACQDVTNNPAQRNPLGTTSDMYIYTNHGRMPTVMFGPGELWRAHGVDECIDVEELLQAAAIYALVAARWCSRSSS